MIERHAERPLRAFLSSVMSTDLQEARNALVKEFDRGAVVEGWAFEYTPASAENLDESYLRHVRDCDMFVYLASRSITIPVRNEVREAIRFEKPILVFRFQDDDADAAAQDVLREIGTRAKWKRVTSVTQLQEAAARALDDYFIRGARLLSSRKEDYPDRRALAEVLLRQSYARVASGLQSLKVPYAKASELARDGLFGHHIVLEFDQSPICVIDGVLGSGKSLVAERHHQRAVTYWLENDYAPIPLFMRAREMPENVHAHVHRCAETLGNFNDVGVALVVDGLDEPGVTSASLLLDKLRELVNALPNSTCVVTGRPHVARLANRDELVSVPDLSPEQIREIVERISGRQVMHWSMSSLGTALRDTLRKPLFAVLYGSLRASDATGQWHKEADLIRELVRRSIRESTASLTSTQDLKHLAIGMLRHGGRPVAPQNLDNLQALEATRLVVAGDAGVAFALPIFTEWFAAEALTDGSLDVETILASDDPDAWVNAIAMAVALAPRKVADEICTKLVTRFPAISATVITIAAEGHTRWGGPDLPPSEEAKSEILRAFESWIEAVHPIRVRPTMDNGRMAPMTVRTVGRSIEVHYHTTPVTGVWDADVNTIFASHYANGRESNAAWAWRFTLDSVRSDLKKIIESRCLHVDAGQSEWLWYSWLGCAGLGSLFSEPLNIRDILEVLSGAPGDAVLGPRYLGAVQSIDALPTVEDLRAHLRSYGHDLWQPPHPGPDRPGVGTRVWSDYSDEGLANRASSIYKSALEIYQQVCNTWFPALKRRFSLFALMPLNLVVQFIPPGAASTIGPIADLAFHPLRHTNENKVSLTVVNSLPSDIISDFEGLRAEVRQLRPGAEKWIRMSRPRGRAALFEDAPAHHIAYRWLQEDLKHIDWIE